MKKKRIREFAAWVLMGCLGLGQILSGASAVLAEDMAADEAQVTFVNEEHNSPDLYISKAVTALVPGYEPDDPSAEFEFELTVDGRPYRDEPYILLDAAGSEVEDPNGSYQTDKRGHFKLHAGETAYFVYVGMDSSYVVEEIASPGEYQIVEPASGKASGTISKLGERVQFVNGYLPEQDEDVPTTFEVSKQIVWPEGFAMPEEVRDAKFDFLVTMGSEPFADQSYEIYSNDGKTKLGSGKTDAEGRLSLSPNQKAVFAEVQSGEEYEVAEEPSEGWRTIGNEIVEGFTTAPLTRVPFTNTNGVFVVKKSMADGSAPEEEFKFRLMDVNQRGMANAKYVVYDADSASDSSRWRQVRTTDASGEFSLYAGQSAVFFGIPNHTIYSIYEEANAAYQQVVPQNANGYQNEAMRDDSVKTYSFVNEKREEKSRLIVGKRVENAEGSILTADPKEEFEFEIRSADNREAPFDEAAKLVNTAFTLESGGGSVVRWTDKDGKFKLKSGDLAVFDELDESKSYLVREVISNKQEGYELKSVKVAFDKETGDTDLYLKTNNETINKVLESREVACSLKETNGTISARVDFSELKYCSSHTAQLTYTNEYNKSAPKGRITLQKKDESGNSLEGVKFELKSNGADGITYIAATDADGKIIFAGKPIESDAGTGDDGTGTGSQNGGAASASSFDLEKYQGLPQGTYTLTETQTKPGLTLLKDPITITIPMAMTQAEVENLKAQNIDVRTEGDDVVYDKQKSTYYFYALTYEITNSPNFVLPVSGSNGFWKLGLLGFATFTAGLWYTLTTRRKKGA